MFRSHSPYVFLLLGLMTLALAGCTGEERAKNWKKAEGAVMQDQELGYSRDDFRRVMAPRPLAAEANKNNVPDLVPVVAEDKKNILPQPLVSISVNQDVPLRDIFYELAKQADVDLELDPTITGSIIFTAHNRPFDQVVDRISEVAGLRYNFKNNVLRVERDTPYLKTYRIDYLGIQRDYISTIHSNTSAATGSSGGGGGGNGSSSTISVANKSDFWAELEKNINQIIINTNQQVSLTDQSGAVSTATAIPVLQPGQLTAVTPPQAGTTPAPLPTPAPGAATAAPGVTTPGTTPPTPTPAPDATAAQNAANTAAQNAATAQLASAAASLAASAANGSNNKPVAGLLNPTGTQTAVATGTGPNGQGAAGGTAATESPYYSVNRQAGLINVFATEKQHRQVAAYISEMRQAINTQVLIEAKVLEVELNDENSLGIDWSLVGNTVSGSIGFPRQNFEFDPVTSTTGGFLNITSGDFSATINAISRFGSVHSLSSPRLTVMNNQTAVLNVSESRVFFTFDINRTEGTANNNPRTEITSTVNNVPEGVIITVHPSIDPDTHEIMMNLRPSITRVVRTVSDPATRLASGNTIESFVPELSIREIDSVVRMNSGTTVIMGGLMQDRTDNRQVSVPVLGELPVVGPLFRSQRDTLRKTEMVILLRAQVLPNARADQADKELYKNLGQDRHPVNP